LRRYTVGKRARCTVNPHKWHDAEVLLDTIPAGDEASGDTWPHDDPRWPSQCRCGYAFRPDDQWMVNYDDEYRRVDTGELLTLATASPGAMYDASWLHDHLEYCGPDGRSLHVKLPNGLEWCIDAPASNCDQKGRPHKCWIRHGEPPLITVDKQGDTCTAGAGSIWSNKGQANDWHGFLRNGVLVR
jgi:hypothetical protein